MHARQTCIQQERQTEGQEKPETDVGGKQKDMHPAGEANRGTGKVRSRCGDTGRQTCIQQER